MKYLSILIVLLLVGCKSAEEHGGQEVVFEFIATSRDEPFKARTSDQDLIEKVRAELSKPLSDRTLHINGAIKHGDGGVNAPWSWSFVEDDWGLSELSVEVCDAWPSYIEENLDKWIDEVGFFCPWSSRVNKEL